MLALFVSPCKMPKPKLRGKFFCQGGLSKGENVFDHTIIIHYKSAKFLQGFCKNQSSVIPYLLIVYCRSASSLS